jgi:hypothetical protein
LKSNCKVTSFFLKFRLKTFFHFATKRFSAANRQAYFQTLAIIIVSNDNGYFFPFSGSASNRAFYNFQLAIFYFVYSSFLFLNYLCLKFVRSVVNVSVQRCLRVLNGLSRLYKFLKKSSSFPPFLWYLFIFLRASVFYSKNLDSPTRTSY